MANNSPIKQTTMSEAVKEEIIMSPEKSMELAMCIEMMKPAICLIDMEYLTEAKAALFNQATRMDTLAPLNRSYSPKKSDLLRKQAMALGALGSFIDELKQVTDLKKRIEEEDKTMSSIEQMFNF